MALKILEFVRSHVPMLPALAKFAQADSIQMPAIVSAFLAGLSVNASVR